VGLFELKKMFEQGVLTGETFLWMKDLDCWQKAKTLDLFPDMLLKSGQQQQSQANLAVSWTEKKKRTYSNGRALIRYFARFFDLSLFSFTLITFVSIFHPKFVFESSALFIFILSLILYILVESVILSVFGNTAGKAILNAKLKTVNGDRLNFLTALQRSIFVSAAGMGFGIPVINFICFYFSYSDLKKHGFSSWDKQIGTVVLYGKTSPARILFVSLFPISLFIAGLLIY
jgi:hypothetical protein